MTDRVGSLGLIWGFGPRVARIGRIERLLLAGLTLLVGLVIAGGYVIVRAASREFAVAQLQSDFVSAVSHEFRTPRLREDIKRSLG